MTEKGGLRSALLAWVERERRASCALKNPPCFRKRLFPGKRCPPSVATQRFHGNKAQTSPTEHPELPRRRRCSLAVNRRSRGSLRVRLYGHRRRTEAHQRLRAALRSAWRGEVTKQVKREKPQEDLSWCRIKAHLPALFPDPGVWRRRQRQRRRRGEPNLLTRERRFWPVSCLFYAVRGMCETYFWRAGPTHKVLRSKSV